jgi:hypothetical protein
MVGLCTGPPAVETAGEGIQSRVYIMGGHLGKTILIQFCMVEVTICMHL